MPPDAKENLRKWVAALRSGNYKQARGYLRPSDDSGYCCLGVACEISGVGSWVPADACYQYVTGVPCKHRGDALPEAVASWLGVDCDDPELDTGDYGTPLRASIMNDIARASFAEIADAIERTYLRSPRLKGAPE